MTIHQLTGFQRRRLSLGLMIALSCAVTSTFAAELKIVNKVGTSLNHGVAEKASPQEQSRTLTELKTASLNNESAVQTYIITGDLPSVASYRGGIEGYESAMSSQDKKLNIQGSSAAAYRAYLQHHQTALIERIEASLGHEVTVLQAMQTAVNALVVQLTPDEVKKISALKGIKSIQKDIQQQLNSSDDQAMYALPSQPELMPDFIENKLNYLAQNSLWVFVPAVNSFRLRIRHGKAVCHGFMRRKSGGARNN